MLDVDTVRGAMRHEQQCMPVPAQSALGSMLKHACSVLAVQS